MTNPSAARSRRPAISVVVPAFNAEHDLDACFRHLTAAGFAPEDVTLVDDASTDRTATIGERHKVSLIRLARTGGPAHARNVGAAACRGEVILFVDADVCVDAAVRDRLTGWFSRLGVDAVFGSYDDAPPHRGVVARYRNLLHHHVHQSAQEEARSFWTGLGAVRRTAMEAVGGFDPTWRYMEDVEFGMRLDANGFSIRLDKKLQGAHRKAWTLASMWRTDLHRRAIPFARLVLLHGGPGGDLNLGWAHKASALAVAGAIAALPAAVLVPQALLLIPAAIAAFVALNWAFLRLLVRVGGVGFAVASVPVHAVHYLAAMLGYGYVYVTGYLPARMRGGRRAAPGRPQA